MQRQKLPQDNQEISSVSSDFQLSLNSQKQLELEKKYSFMKKVNIALAAACVILVASMAYVNYRANQEYIPYPADGHAPPDPILVAALKEYYKEKSAKTIIDIGCGQCKLISILKDEGYEVLGVDSTPYSNASYVQQRDLSRPLNLGRTFDYVQSFQVGEHIYSQFEETFIGNLARHAKHGIVMSWAVPGQGGIQHKNERSNEYIIKKVEKLGFKYNHAVTMRYKPKFDNWFKNTLMFFDKV